MYRGVNMRLGKRERLAKRERLKELSAIRARALAVPDTGAKLRSYLGPLVDGERGAQGTKQVSWEYRSMYFNGTPRKGKVRVA